MKCDTCGKDMSYPDKNGFAATAIGMCWSYQGEGNAEFDQKQLGIYKIGKTYNVCWECCLKAFNIKA